MGQFQVQRLLIGMFLIPQVALLYTFVVNPYAWESQQIGHRSTDTKGCFLKSYLLKGVSCCYAHICHKTKKGKFANCKRNCCFLLRDLVWAAERKNDSWLSRIRTAFGV